jgi:hypothetical protein
MLDRLISINDRIPLSPYVTLPPVSDSRTHNLTFAFFLSTYLFFSLFGGRGRMYHLIR